MAPGVVAGDIDGDGIPNLVCNEILKVGILLGTGNGIFDSG